MRKPNGVIMYNVIFPLWITIFVPPLTLIPLIGNLVIDGAVIWLSLKKQGVTLERKALRKWILSAWGLGFLADIIGALLLLGLSMLADAVGYLKFDTYAIWGDPVTVIAVLLIVAFSGWLIYRFNRWLGRKAGADEAVAHRVALWMGIITAPWMFLVPTTLFL